MSSFPVGSFMGRMLRCPIKKVQKVWIEFFQSAWEPMTTTGRGARKPDSAYPSLKLYGIVLPITNLCDVALGNSEGK